MKYYVVSDIHGYYTYLEQALKNAGFFDEKEPCKLIVCGDLLDRGPEAKALVDFMIRLLEEDKLVYILGNHEDYFVRCLHEIATGRVFEIASGMSVHYSNKTWDSMLQLSEMSENEAYKNHYELMRRVRNSPFYKVLLEKGVDYFETPHYIFTHGWIPCRIDGVKPFQSYYYDPDWRCADVDAWKKARWHNGIDLACKYRVIESGKIIVCGHWHTSYGHSHFEHRCSEWGKDADFSPFTAEGIIAIDASTPNSLKVNCIVIED